MLVPIQSRKAARLESLQPWQSPRVQKLGVATACPHPMANRDVFLNDFHDSSGANKDQGTTDNGATPLFIAAQKGHLEVVRFLVVSGANKDQGKTDKGETPLFVAAENGHLEVVRLLVMSGANKDQGRTDSGATPLFIAAENGRLEVVRFLGSV